jgi:hypothetical protein
MGTGSDNGKFNTKKRKSIQKHEVAYAREIVMLRETLKQKVHTKAQRITSYETRKNQCTKNKMLKADTKTFTDA